MQIVRKAPGRMRPNEAERPVLDAGSGSQDGGTGTTAPVCSQFEWVGVGM